MAAAATCGAGTVENEPSSLPIGVRRAATMYDEDMSHLATIVRHTLGEGRASRAEGFESDWHYVLRHHQGHSSGPWLRLHRTRRRAGRLFPRGGDRRRHFPSAND